MPDLSAKVIEDFGQEWQKFDHAHTAPAEEAAVFDSYFSIFPWSALPAGACGFDLGCGSGRWARSVAPRVGRLHCIDPSPAALAVARRNLAQFTNCQLHQAAVEAIPLPDGSADFGYCLGVLHHLPDPARGLAACVAKLKPAAPFLLYLYYAFDNRPHWFRFAWRCSELVRRAVGRMPAWLKLPLCDGLAAAVYWPLARAARALERLGCGVESFPLSAYRSRSFYMMRNDALDRFGTAVEKRFTKVQMLAMMQAAGLEGIEFSPRVPYWCAVGRKRRSS